MNIHENAVIVRDKKNTYWLITRTSEATIRTNLEASIEDPELRNGFVLEIDRARLISQMIGKTRAICTRDGRIYVEESMQKDKQYMRQAIPILIEEAKKIFQDRELSRAYERIA